MRKVSSFWHTLRQIDEQAGAFNHYYNMANQFFDMIIERHRRDFAAIKNRFRPARKKK